MVARTPSKIVLAISLAAIALFGDACLADKRTLQVGGGDGGNPEDSGGTVDPDAGDQDTGVAAPCDPVKQTGCGATEKCSLNSKSETTCVADGNRTTGSPCTLAPDSCVKTNICLSPTGAPYCRQFCAKNADCTQSSPPGQPQNEPLCAFEVTKTVKVCSVPCNPVPTIGKSGCVSGVACVYGNLGATGLALSDCNRKAGNGRNDSACTSTGNECADGFTCVTKCRAYCRSGSDIDCDGGPGYTCVPIATGAPFGVCCPPSPTPC